MNVILTEEDYKKLLRQERQKDEPDHRKILYYKFKLGIMPVQKTEINTYFDQLEKYLHKVDVSIQEIHCDTFEEYLKNQDLPDIIINRHIFK